MVSAGKRKRKERNEGRERREGDAGRFFDVCLRRSDNEMTSDRDEILDGDSLQRGEHFY